MTPVWSVRESRVFKASLMTGADLRRADDGRRAKRVELAAATAAWDYEGGATAKG
jgi:hypothetical protein